MKRVFLLLLLLAGRTVFAATISGHVTDAGKAVAEAYVALYEAQGSVIVATMYTGADGAYRLTAGDGSYRLCASAQEYATGCVSAVVVNGGGLSLDIEITPSGFVDKSDKAPSDGCD